MRTGTSCSCEIKRLKSDSEKLSPLCDSVANINGSSINMSPNSKIKSTFIRLITWRMKRVL